jgi:cobyrinic acid a,c-diamide synthase
MVLGETLETTDGTYPMAGLLGHATSFARRRLNLGYREATLTAATSLGPAGTILRGHEFHYASTTDPGPDTAFCTLRDGLGQDLGPAGGRRGHVTGTFFHAIARISP